MNKEIYVITNRNLVSSDEEYFKVIEGIAKAKVDYIILREKEFSDEKLYLVAKKILLIIGNRKTKLIINSNITVYSRLDNVMLHLRFNDFLKYKKLLNEKVGVSIHSVEEVEIVEKLAPLYILASNIYETKCKIGLAGKGIGFISEIKKKTSSKIVALGGINRKNISEIIESEADGFAIMSEAMESSDSYEVIKGYRNI